MADDAVVICPKCAGAVQGGGDYPTWCPKCRWGVDRAGASAAVRPLPGSRARYAAYRRLLVAHRERPPRPGRWSWRRVVLVALATVIHLLGVSLLMLGAIWAVRGDVFEGLLVLLVAVLACPWLKQSHQRTQPLPAPVDEVALLRWATELADRVGVKAPQRLFLAPSYFASTSRSPRGVRELKLGLLLFAVLDQDERDAVLLHEFGHWAGNDPSRALWVYSALIAVERPLLALRALDRDEPGDPLVRRAAGYDAAKLAFPPLLLLTIPLRLLRALFVVLSAEDRMEAEYAADHAAAQAGGAEPWMRALRLSSQYRDLQVAVRAQVNQRVVAIDWAEVRASMLAVPVSEVSRRLMASEDTELRRNDSHPPTIDRLRQLQRWTPAAPLPAGTSSVDVDAAVRPAVEAWSRMLANSW